MKKTIFLITLLVGTMLSASNCDIVPLDSFSDFLHSGHTYMSPLYDALFSYSDNRLVPSEFLLGFILVLFVLFLVGIIGRVPEITLSALVIVSIVMVVYIFAFMNAEKEFDAYKKAVAEAYDYEITIHGNAGCRKLAYEKGFIDLKELEKYQESLSDPLPSIDMILYREYSGGGKVFKDKKLAMQYLKSAAAHGDSTAKSELVRVILSGEAQPGIRFKNAAEYAVTYKDWCNIAGFGYDNSLTTQADALAKAHSCTTVWNKYH